MIKVNNLAGGNGGIDEIFFKKIAKIVLIREKKVGLDLSIALVGQNEIKELNKKYRKKNKATDVLSFKYDDNSGEVIICPGKTKDIPRVLVHGILHILGYNHERTKKEAKIMEKKENYYLKK